MVSGFPCKRHLSQSNQISIADLYFARIALRHSLKYEVELRMFVRNVVVKIAIIQNANKVEMYKPKSCTRYKPSEYITQYIAND